MMGYNASLVYEERLISEYHFSRRFFMANIRMIPMLPLRGLLVFPYMMLHLDVGREKSIEAVEAVMLQDRQIMLSSQKDSKIDEPTAEDICEIGTVAEIKQVLKLPGGMMRVLVEGLYRAKIVSYEETEPHYVVQVEEYHEEEIMSPEIEALMRAAVHQFEEWVKASQKIPPETLVSIVETEDQGRMADLIASHLVLKLEDKQFLLDAVDLKTRYERLCEILARELEIIALERKISARVRKQMEKTQKEYYLREQLKAIQKELGDRDERLAEAAEYREKLATGHLPANVRAKAEKEIKRLEKMQPISAESAVVRTYLDWLFEVPWLKETEDILDIDHAESVLEAEHYGLEKVKERIVEYLSVRKLTKTMKGPILCLVGPPGVGKTSLAHSVAHAMNRKFVRVSLGGVRDEAEIRGHRRTYIGAMPGRIIQGMRTAGSCNPVFLLDEIDKMSADFRGDPSAALLEVLDPEQNNTFSDHYMELPYDLSKILWIVTANSLHNIPRPLLDRMEIIQLSSYTDEEKIQIAKRYLIPKQQKEHGLTDELVTISSGAIPRIIADYTRESGVRELERNIASVFRKSARQIVQDKKKQIRVTAQNVGAILGKAKYHHTQVAQEGEIGLVTGLAWTQVGGEVLPTEVVILAGKGNLTLTGKLGDVMKESAKAGISYIRSRAEELAIAPDFYEKNDIHIHLPEGAIPKDGPSAGITMATAVISALSGRAVKGGLAMTGEITIRGRVLAVGGIKEKVLAAYRQGIHTVIMPKKNEKDIDELPTNVKRAMRFVLVETMDEVLKEALTEHE